MSVQRRTNIRAEGKKTGDTDGLEMTLDVPRRGSGRTVSLFAINRLTEA